jgi:hypothetical protein
MYWRARVRHMNCEAFCGQLIVDGAPVWRGPLRPRWPVVGHGPAQSINNQFAAGKRREFSVCADCASSEQMLNSRISWSSQPRSCVGCGRPIFYIAMPSRYIRYPVCGDTTCYHAAMLASQRERWRIAAGSRERRCKVCGIKFEPKRKDKVYCSVPCRLKAYRQRRAAD